MTKNEAFESWFNEGGFDESDREDLFVAFGWGYDQGYAESRREMGEQKQKTIGNYPLTTSN